MSSPIIPSNGPVAAFSTSSSGGGNLTTSGTKYDPFAIPSVPHALDAEFTSSIAPLTEFDIDNVMTTAVDDRGAVLTISTTISDTTVTGALQPLPNGFTNFTIEARVGQYITEYVNNTYFLNGLMLTNGNASNSKIYSWSFVTGYNIEHSVYAHSFTDYHNLNTVDYARSIGRETVGMFLRIRKNNTHYDFDYSLDGLGWMYVYSIAIASFPFTPTHFGIMLDYVSSDGTQQSGVFSFLRYKAEDVTPRGFIGGQRVNYYAP